MFGVFRAVLDRVKAVLVLKAAEELEAEAAADAADRQAGLIDVAARYDRGGMPDVAAGLRARVLRPESAWGPAVKALGTGSVVPAASVPPVGGGNGGGVSNTDKPAKRPR